MTVTLPVLARDTAPHLKPFRYRSIASTHPGAVRKINEDGCLDRADVGLWAVADGMGGHDSGDMASETVVRALAEVSEFESAFAFRRAVRTALFAANARLLAAARERKLGPIGSTVVAFLAHGRHYACMWAGDSRAYILRAGRLERITRDHSLAQELISAGQLQESEARSFLRANVVTRSVGAAPRLDLEGVYGRIDAGDRFLLCSDGVAAVMNDNDIEKTIEDQPLPLAATALMRTCLQRGAPDNVTCILIDAAG